MISFSSLIPKSRLKGFPFSFAFFPFFFLFLSVGRLRFSQILNSKPYCLGTPPCQHHPGKLNISKLQGNSGKTYNKDNACQRQISGLAVIHVIVNQHTKAGGSDHPVKKERNPTDHRTGNGTDQGCQFTEGTAGLKSTAAPPITCTL